MQESINPHCGNGSLISFQAVTTYLALRNALTRYRCNLVLAPAVCNAYIALIRPCETNICVYTFPHKVPLSHRDEMVLKTLFLQAPSFDGFDGGAGSRYQAKREVKSFWYPTWLAQPAALVANSRLFDAIPHGIRMPDVLKEIGNYDLAVLHTSSPSFTDDVKAIKT